MASEMTSDLSSLDNLTDEHIRKALRERCEHDILYPAAHDLPEDGPKQHFWDLPQIIPRDRKERDVDEDRGLQVIKAAAYILFFAILLWCSVTQKLSLMTLVAYQYNRIANATESQEEERKTVAAGKHLLLAIAIMIPYCLTFLTSLFKWMFGSFQFPGFPAILFCIVMETIHSLGLCALVFIILPDMDIVRGLWLLNGVAILPSILYPITASELRTNKGGCLGRIGVFSLSVFAAVVQVAFIPLVILFDNFVAGSTMDSKAQTIVIFIIAMLFVSFSWWENFSDDRFCGRTNDNSIIKTKYLKLKFNLQESRPVISFFTSLWKIGITCLLTWLTKQYKPFSDSMNSEHHGIDGVSMADAFRKLGDMPLKDNAAVLTLTLTTFVGFYVAYTTCKLKIQKFSFSFPLIISTPLTVVIASVDCRPSFNLLIPFTNELQNVCEQHDEVNEWVGVYIAGVVVLASLYWLCRHIFSPNIERLARTERLFMNPFYCSILFEQHLILNRRRHNRRVKKEIDPDKEFYSLSEYNFKVNIEGDEEEDRDSKQGSEEEETDIYADGYRNRKFRDIPMIYACATMWHETKIEMIQLMKSIFRMDRDQNIRRNAEILTGKEDKDFYEFEAHIFFDDCMDLDDDEELVPNSFVRELLSVLQESVNSVYAKSMKLMQPFIVPTPYGGQIVYQMPGENFLFIHLKDKTKIRHKKRWSQVMYMYYLLGYRIVRYCQETVTEALKHDRINELLGWEDGETVHGGQYGRSHIFHAFDEQTLRKASNTFVLALDGDVDFSPGAVKLLVDRMKKSEKVGAACGRIHPIGTGPVVWFQKFEYAIAHWLQKATEHVLGCVLCSPGCFSLFRGSALMDDNIMKKYTILPTEASHHLMYDQGEDRWLCTLLLQQGYRVDYAAGSDAFTYAPEGFAEFFNQRRRWMPSTVFNIIDLLADYQNTVYVNSNISMLYIFYQASLLLSTIIGPATVLMMIAGANLVVFKTNLIESYIIAMVPALFYFVVCFYVKPKLQIQLAEILTGMYAFVMMIVLVATIVTAAKNSPFHPSVIFIVILMIAFSFSALLHPKEWTNVIYGALYFILIPTGFLLLIIYSMANLHVVSWGTREVPKKKSKEEMEAEKKALEEKKRKKKEQGFFGRFMPAAVPTQELKDLISKITETKKKERVSNSETVTLLKDLNDSMKTMIKIQIETKNNVPLTNDQMDNALKKVTIRAQEVSKPSKPSPTKGILKDPLKPTQRLSLSISKKEPEVLTEDGSTKPKRNDLSSRTSEDNIEEERTSETQSSSSGPIKNLEVDALGLMFVFFYLLILMIQFAGMIMHRWGTFLHLVSVTKLVNPLKGQSTRKPETPKGLSANEARKACERLLEEPLSDYPEDEELEKEQERECQENAKRQLELLQKTGNRLRVTVNNKGIGASTRLLDQSQSVDPSLLAQSARMLARMPSTHHLRRTVTMTSLDVTRREAQHILHRQHDQYRNRPLPPVIKSRRRLNTGAVRYAMISRWDNMLQNRNSDITGTTGNETKQAEIDRDTRELRYLANAIREMSSGDSG
ncbi:chitin synthase chs-1-like [Dreissena polymorpha]|uniref:chitin synthase chs-1-like n=1 Tax=Dreissena polymorpha TaxID=45954 RepID=UPI002264AF24|nr:chitin synthase chs-1-like [Dreissena polymorpha]